MGRSLKMLGMPNNINESASSSTYLQMLTKMNAHPSQARSIKENFIPSKRAFFHTIHITKHTNHQRFSSLIHIYFSWAINSPFLG
jgi:hypothetical protein